MAVDLSILIPSRNEMFLARTIQDILEHARGSYEVIAVVDGAPDPSFSPLPDDEHLTTLLHTTPVGQRAGCNEAVKIASGRYVMKVDAHCAFDEGFDQKLLEYMGPGLTMAPVMRNLHAFDWVCVKCGDRRYQGPTPQTCPFCDGSEFVRDVVWFPKPSPASTSYCFDATPHFQYFGEYVKRAEVSAQIGREGISESMSLQGSAFLMERERYLALGVNDERWGSWGSQGIEVAVKTWLSGGRVVINHHTWYAHMFRTQGGDFGFPYPLSGREVERAKQSAKGLFFNGTQWEHQTRPLSWLVEKFWPVPGWTEADLTAIGGKVPSQFSSRDENLAATKIEMTTQPVPGLRPGRKPRQEWPAYVTSKPEAGIVYYTDNRLDPLIMDACQRQLLRASGGRRIISVSLAPLSFGENITLPLERGYLTMFQQILEGIKALDSEWVFFAEHDVLYHPSHFDFTPPNKDVVFYNQNVWKVNIENGHALHYDCSQTSGLAASRALMLAHYTERVEKTRIEWEKGGNTRDFRNFIREQGFEPGSHKRQGRVDNLTAQAWFSPFPNIDIRHDLNLTPSRWRKDQFINQRNTRGWTEAETVEGWNYPPGLFRAFLEKVLEGSWQ